MPTPKFLRNYGSLTLRVIQRWPGKWYATTLQEIYVIDGSGKPIRKPSRNWNPTTSAYESGAKHAAIATASSLIGPPPNGSDTEWRDLSDDPDEDWNAKLEKLEFPGYLDL
jgi:hypothetical protein